MNENLEKIFNGFVKKPQIHRAFCFVEDKSGSFSWKKVYGDKDFGDPFVIASITKMFTATCIFQLIQNNRLSLDDRLEKYLSPKIMKSLFVYKGTDYSSELTIHHLLLQSSGFPDDFESELSSKKKLEILKKSEYTFEEEIEDVKKLKPHFAPCYDKAFYANINYDILGKIIEIVTGKPLAEVYDEFICIPLGLKQTYLYQMVYGEAPSVFFDEEKICFSRVLECAYASGGIVSNATDLMIFLKAFFLGGLFDMNILEKMKNYRKLQFNMGPIHYGAGHMQVQLKGILTAFRNKGELLGHFGSTGSFAFYYPKKELFFVGDLSQLANPALPIRMLIKMAFSL